MLHGLGDKEFPYTVEEQTIWEKPFCKLKRFVRTPKEYALVEEEFQSKLLIVAPISGHHATLMRGTIEAFLPYYDIYLTEWADAKEIPLTVGSFDLDDYIDYLIEFTEIINKIDSRPLHVYGICQPGVPLVAAVALMETNGSPYVPTSMTLTGSPIDVSKSPTKVNEIPQERGITWFRENCLAIVSKEHPGVGRNVYPGFLQVAGFIAMNIDRHIEAHINYYNGVVSGDEALIKKHCDFYDEYLSTMDITSEFYLQTIETVFIKNLLAKGQMTHRGWPVDLNKIHRVALQTIEGSKDDVTGLGQTRAAHDLCSNIYVRDHYMVEGVGHYGLFAGSKFREDVVPRILAFHKKVEGLHV